MQLRLPRRRFWRLAIYSVSILLVLAAADLALVEHRRAIHPGYDTTRITAPMDAGGTIDYLVAIDDYFGRGVSPENNAAPLLIEAIGRSALASNQPPDGITDRLGMPHLPEAGEYFVTYEKFTKGRADAAADPDPTDATRNDAWPLKVSPATVAWINANVGPLAKIEQAAARPKFFMPFYGGNRPETLAGILLPYLNPFLRGDVPRALLTRASLRLEAGDTDGCRRDLMTVHRLARLLGQGATMIDRLVGTALEIDACRAGRAALATGKFKAEESRAMAAELAGLADLPPMVDAMDVSERYMLLDTMQLAARVGPVRAGEVFNHLSGRNVMPPQVFRWIPMPYEQTMREANLWYDGALVASRQRTYAERAAALQAWEAATSHLHSNQQAFEVFSADWPLSLFLPALNRASVRTETARTERRLSQVACALAAYNADHGSYPATLADLTPQYLAAIPLDSFSEKPLRYAPTPKGYTLYSVGPNLIDDGGKDSQPGDDVVANAP
ncbi:MAG: hypothetical protein JWN24_1127 [Phycisphaerales bacterium]|nr:hypothetical protein [Phycisphaerales bacterium]